MNKLYIFLLILLSNIVLAQNYNRAEHSGIQSTFNIASINSKSFFIYNSRPVGTCCRDYVFLQGRNASGALLFDTVVTTDPFLDNAKVYVTSDKALLTYAGTRMKGCDYGGSRFVVAKYDTNGVLQWKLTVLKTVNCLLPRPMAGFFFMIATDTLYHYSGNGNLISKNQLSLGGPFYNACMMNNGHIMINFNYASSNRLREIDSLGVAQNEQLNAAVYSQLVQTPSGNYFGISQGQISKLNSTLGLVVSTTSTTSAASTYSAFQHYNDSIFAVGTTSANVPTYLVFNNNLQLGFQSTSNLESVGPTGISVASDNTARVITTGASVGGSNHTFSGYFQTSKFGNLTGTKDIGVVDVQLLSSTVYGLTFYSSTVNFYQAVLSVQADVKNFGTDTVKFFKLNYYGYRGGLGYCLFGLNQSFNLTIPPGGTVSVITNTFTSEMVNISGLAADGSFQLNTCLYTSIPDHTNDFVFDNNAVCKLFRMETVGIEENDLSALISIYPNPANTSIKVEANNIIKKFQLIDANGRLVKEDLLNNSFAEISILDLPNGIYFLSLETESGTVRRKIAVVK